MFSVYIIKSKQYKCSIEYSSLVCRIKTCPPTSFTTIIKLKKNSSEQKVCNQKLYSIKCSIVFLESTMLNQYREPTSNTCVCLSVLLVDLSLSGINSTKYAAHFVRILISNCLIEHFWWISNQKKTGFGNSHKPNFWSWKKPCFPVFWLWKNMLQSLATQFPAQEAVIKLTADN